MAIPSSASVLGSGAGFGGGSGAEGKTPESEVNVTPVTASDSVWEKSAVALPASTSRTSVKSMESPAETGKSNS